MQQQVQHEGVADQRQQGLHREGGEKGVDRELRWLINIKLIEGAFSLAIGDQGATSTLVFTLL